MHIAPAGSPPVAGDNGFTRQTTIVEPEESAIVSVVRFEMGD